MCTSSRKRPRTSILDFVSRNDSSLGPGTDCLFASAVLDKRAVVQLVNRLAQLLLSIHHNRAIPRHRLLDWLSRHKQEPNSLRSGLHGKPIEEPVAWYGPI